jgi:hypothetical protein
LQLLVNGWYTFLQSSVKESEYWFDQIQLGPFGAYAGVVWIAPFFPLHGAAIALLYNSRLLQNEATEEAKWTHFI